MGKIKEQEIADIIEEIKQLQKEAEARIKKIEPIIVYQMGKVASSTIVKTLREAGYTNLFQPHRILAENIAKYEKKADKSNEYYIRVDEEGKFIDRYNLVNGAKIITLVREPIERNFSAFFQNYKMMTGDEFQNSKASTDKMIEKFIHNYPHETPIRWFEDEFNKVLGIDIYDYPFDHKKGYSIIDANGISILAMQSEINDETKNQALQLFLGNSSIHISRANESSKKDYSEAYRKFKKEIVLPASYIEEMYDSNYSKYFYSPEEIEIFRQKWSKNTKGAQ